MVSWEDGERGGCKMRAMATGSSHSCRRTRVVLWLSTQERTLTFLLSPLQR